MQTTLFAKWVLALMLALRAQYGEKAPAWADSYESTAAAIAATCEGQSLDRGSQDWCAAVLVDLAWHESRLNPGALGDGGKAHGLFQVHTSEHGMLNSADPAIQSEGALKLVKASWEVCGGRPVDERLAWYLTGRGACNRALGVSRFRIGEAKRLLIKHPMGSP
jgi:hypothetical protein